MINSSDYKDRAISLGWIAGLLIIISLLWILTQPLQERYLLRTVNRAFITAGQPYRVTASLAQNGKNAFLLGYWYSMLNTTDRMFVFAVIRDGILVPLGARVSANGDVEEIIPLSAHAVQTMENIPHSVMRMYVARIEAIAKRSDGGKAR